MVKLIYSAFIYFRCVRYGGIDRSKSLGLRGGGSGEGTGSGGNISGGVEGGILGEGGGGIRVWRSRTE
jgi:hypothetical protein